MRIFKTMTFDQTETMAWGTALSERLQAGDIVCLFGELGTGKTTFVKGLARGLKISPRRVNSPTFVLLNRYQGRIPMYHFDFYRLDTVQEIHSIGYEEFLYGEGIAVIEWADKMRSLIPVERMDIFMSHGGGNQRLLEFKSYGSRYERFFRFFKTFKI